jgi:hypothetical protein
MSLFHRRFATAALSSLVLSAASLLIACPASAQVYKWVDSNGVTHYDGSPPASSAVNTKTLPISTAPAPTDSGNESWQEKDNAFKSRYDKRKAEEAKQEDSEKKALAARQTACIKAQQRLDFLQTYSRIYHVDSNGNRVFDTDQQHEQDLANTRQAVAQNCHG